jgi:RNA polymerase sigma-70 factor, ECF subfamily
MSDFPELLARAKTGDAAAVSELYRRFGADVSALIRSRLSPLLRQHYDTEDLWQSVFVEVLRDLPRFEDRGESAFRNWLLLKGRAKVGAKLRRHVGPGRRRVEERVDSEVASRLPGREPEPAAETELLDEGAALGRALDSLAEVDREIVRLHSVEDVAFTAIAERLGLVSAESARKRFARALLKLRSRAKR